MSLGVWIFIIGLLLSVMLHEAGHMATAKHYGMKVTKYFVGFGPTLFSFRRGETEYGVKAIPAGGFVKIVGMTDLEEIEPGDEDRAFYKAPAKQRAVVLSAGSLTHFVLAFVLVYVTLVFVGLPASSTVVGEVSRCLPVAPATECTPSDPLSPAAEAGLRPGDRIVAFNGLPVQEWETDLTRAIRAHAGGPATVDVERDGRPLAIRVQPRVVVHPDPDNPGKTIQVTQIGLRPRERIERAGFVEGAGDTLGQMRTISWGTLKGIVSLPGQIPNAVRSAVSGRERTADQPISLVGAAQFSSDFRTALGILAALNFFIGVLNLLPLLPLDGGHLAILGYESLRSRFARWLRLPDPGRVDIRKLMPVAYVVVLVLGSLSLLLIYADVTNPITNPFG